MLDPELLKLMRCPQTQQTLQLAPPELIAQCNRQIAMHALLNQLGVPVTEPIEGGLIRADGQVLYPIRSEIALLLFEESIRVEQT